ncbi:acyl-CoA dehydrogenase family protein [soil metagenome]
MDFSLNDEQTAVADLARRILGELCTAEHLTHVEAGSEWFDRSTWQALATADLLGLTLPESVGGGGYGFFETCLLLREAGRAVAPIPLWSTLIGARTIAEFGSEDQRQRVLPGVAAGETVIAVALTEAGAPDRLPLVFASWQSGQWSLSGVATTVGAAHVAQHVLVPARTADDEVRLLLGPTDSPGITIERQDTFNHEPQFRVTFDEVRISGDAALDTCGEGEAALQWVLDRATVGLCAVAAGIADAAMRLTAAYVSERKQFDRAIGTFQAVGQRMADCYVDAGAIELTMFAAASALDTAGIDETIDPTVVPVAKYWASYGGSRVAHAGLHLHGGISIDLDYPIHRYFLSAKHLEFQLGVGTEQLAHIGATLANVPIDIR